ncbi:MAG: ATP cone domain-containing protein [Chloroflexota bacterium]
MGTIQSVVKRNGATVPFNPERITNAIYRAAVEMGGRDRATAERLSQQVIQILEAQTPPEHIPTVEEIQDLVEKVLIENGHARVAKAYILYRAERARLRQEHTGQTPRDSKNIPWAKLWHALDWAVERGVNTVAGLNDRIARGEFPKIVQEAEAMYSEEIKNAAAQIIERRAELRTVIITGPSSSGKTTTTIKVGERLKRAGLNLVTLNVDNYFFDLELHPKDEFGDYDFETPQALDLALISQHLARLIAGEEVRIPFYDMKTGHRANDHTPMKLRANDIILIDSLHGLFPEMTKDVSNEQKFKLYLEPLLQMKGPDDRYVRWTDLRLIRRMLRDAVHRAYDPRRTLLHWHYVRSSEMRNIIPRINETDCVVNTGMAFELPLYRPRLLDQFTRWEQEFQGDPLREDAYKRARRVRALLQAVTPVADDSPVPPDSVLREFIGGSVYEY